MKNTIIRENLSIEDAKNVAEELKIYGYKVEITGEGKHRTVTATKGDAVTTICYGQKRAWPDRWDAIDFFREGTEACDGAEKERYTTILLKLLAGEEICTDDHI